MNAPGHLPGRLGKGFLIAFFLLGLPFLLADSALTRSSDLDLQRLEERRLQELEEYQQRLVLLRDPDTLLRRVLYRFVQMAERSPDRLKKAVALARTLSRRYPRLFSFNVLDGAGNIRFRAGDDAPPDVPRRVGQLLRKARQTWKQPGFAFHPDLALYLGRRQNPVRCDLLKGTSWLEVSTRPTKTWFFAHFDPEFGLLVHVHQGGFHPILGIRQVLQRRRASPMQVHLVDLDTLSPLACHDAAYARLASQIIGQVGREPITRLVRFGRVWSVDRVDARYLLLSSFPHDAGALRADRLRPFRVSAGLLFLAGWLTTVMILGRPRGLALSIRWKLLGLFLLVGGLPLFILSSLAGAYLRNLEDGLARSREESARQSLETFEERFQLIFRSCEKRLNHLLRSIPSADDRWEARLVKPLRDYLRKYAVNGIYVLRKDRPVVVLKPGGFNEEQTKLRFFSQFLGVILRQVLGEIRPQDQLFIMQMGMGAEQSLGMDFEQIIGAYLRNLGKIVPMSLGPTENFTCLQLLPWKRSPPEAILAVHWSRADLERKYFSRFLPLNPSPDGTELVLVRQEGQDSLVPDGEPQAGGGVGRPFSVIRRSHIFIPQRPLPPAFWRFFERVRSRGQSMSGRLWYKSQPCLVVGQPGKRFPGYAVFAITPLESVRKRLAHLELRLRWFVIGCLVFSGFLGVLLTRQFLRPVDEMTLGIEAVRGNRFDHRVSHAGGDELGILAVQFNRMMDNLEGMVDAKMVQQGLLPGQPLAVGDFRVCGASRPTSDLGGDYFDYLALPGDRLLVLHGDVAGHGARAALVMAMVKGVVNHLGHAGAPASDLQRALTGMIHRVMQRRLLMSLAILDIDTRSGEATLYNCGNPYPYQFRNDGTLVEIKAFGPLVGFSPKAIVTPVRVDLQPGERLVFYSDGLVEPLVDLADDAYEEFRRYLGQFRGLSLTEFPGAVIRNHPVLARHGSFPDDATVVVVERIRPTSVG